MNLKARTVTMYSVAMACALALGTCVTAKELADAAAGTAVPHAVTALPAGQMLRFGDTVMTADAYHRLVSELPPRFAEYERRRSPEFALNYAKNRVLADAARQQHLENDPGVAARLRMAQDEVLAASLAQHLADDYHPDDATLHGYFDSHRTDYTRYQLSHILVRCDDGCKDPAAKAKAWAKITEIQRALKAGGDFTALATARSEDPQTAGQGGAIDQTLGRFIAPEFKAAVLALKEGQITAPLASAHGFHLIRLDNIDAPDFASSRDWVLKEMQDTHASDRLRQLETQADIRLSAESFDETAPASR
ncbi:peptidylprolyl isomerase [Luteibacter sp. ME-Dv--P-043b]|jgi:parvulin-like peptidyl-prolyl isomerase|uniref:peptidylprolyl isomerase n=1 Tax=Luteibacter sp. ME-Dv--P-043b TaxID=3040291 RepID=UPI0025542AE1|nr:peptidylprolyl isomerase [Luteibacter sp. ME-Dv--P-043b]